MTMPVSASTTLRMPDGWSLRQVAGLLAREWLGAFRAAPNPKAQRWSLQAVIDMPEDGAGALWEAGISTEEYEARLTRANPPWAIRAGIARGRGKGTVLARLAPVGPEGNRFEVTVFEQPLPHGLFDGTKIADFLEAHDTDGVRGLILSLLQEQGMHLD